MSRIKPLLPVDAYRTFEASAPLRTHWRRATCAEVDCPRHRDGFGTTVVRGSDQEAWIRESGRRWISATPGPDGTIIYKFPPGTECWTSFQHRIRVRDDLILTSWRGDWRGRLGDVRRHTRDEDWVDEFATNQDRLTTLIRRG